MSAPLKPPIPVTDIPDTSQITNPWLKQIAIWMDQYREIRLIWHGIDAILGLVILLVLLWLVVKIKLIHREMNSKQSEVEDLVHQTVKTAKDVNRTYRRLNLIDENTEQRRRFKEVV